MMNHLNLMQDNGKSLFALSQYTKVANSLIFVTLNIDTDATWSTLKYGSEE